MLFWVCFFCVYVSFYVLCLLCCCVTFECVFVTRLAQVFGGFFVTGFDCGGSTVTRP